MFGLNIPDTSGHQTTLNFPIHSTFASALPAKNRTSEIRVKINKTSTKHPLHYRL